ncbi:hypothetical protein TWF730_010320 [Orbilia blumenaviensis]|uniref:Uncharacterized protein n=1 Tax=Orbilia blumenaviensis TaxID=1796055 RepID=A0AAV9URD6_9PEZI
MNNTETQRCVEITVSSFIDNEMPKVHPAFRNPSRFDNQTAQRKLQPAFSVLEKLLREKFQSRYGIQDQDLSLADILERLDAASNQNAGESSIIRKAWLGLGDRSEKLKAWLELIPEDYGLNIVKAGFGIILEMANESAKNRDKINDTISKVFGIVSEIEINAEALDWDKVIRESALDLFGIIADILTELLKLVPADRQSPEDNRSSSSNSSNSKSKSSKTSSLFHSIAPKTTRSSRHEIERISENLEDLLAMTERKATRLHSRIGSRRDKTIMDIHKLTLEEKRESSAIRYNTQSIDTRSKKMDQNMEKMSGVLDQATANVKHISEAMEQQGTELKSVKATLERYEEMFRENTANVSKRKMGFLMDGKLQQEDLESIAELFFAKHARSSIFTVLTDQIKKQIIASTESQTSAILRKLGNSEPLLPLKGFIMLLASRKYADGAKPSTYDIKAVLAQPHQDLKSILTRVQDFDAKCQSQAQSMIQNQRFLTWMTSQKSDILLVDGNLPSSASDNLSAMSLFSATFAISMVSVRPDDVFVQFFCGLHTAANRDWFYGPSGLVRSLILQLVRALDQRNDPDLSFIDSNEYIQGLEEHDLVILCSTVEKLVIQFPPGTNIFCVIDGISVYDKEYQGLFWSMKFVLSRLQDIVRNEGLETNFKILCTTPGRSTLKMKGLVELECHINLSSNNLNAGEINEYTLRTGLPRSAPPSRPRTPNGIWEQENCPDSRGSGSRRSYLQ